MKQYYKMYVLPTGLTKISKGGKLLTSPNLEVTNWVYDFIFN